MTAILVIAGGCLGACSFYFFRQASRFSSLVEGDHNIKHSRPAHYGDWPHLPSGSNPFGAATDGDIQPPSLSSKRVHPRLNKAEAQDNHAA